MDFNEVFSQTLKRRGLTHRAFADLVRVSPVFISQCASRHSKPPLDRVQEWADKLNLKGAERKELIDAAFAAHVPDPVLFASKAYASILEAWLAAERGDTGPWHPDIHGHLPESPRARELRELREICSTSSDVAAVSSLRAQLVAVTADRDAARAELAALRAQLAALLSTPAQPTLETPGTTDKTPEPRRLLTPDEVMAISKRMARSNLEHARSTASKENTGTSARSER